MGVLPPAVNQSNMRMARSMYYEWYDLTLRWVSQAAEAEVELTTWDVAAAYSNAKFTAMREVKQEVADHIVTASALSAARLGLPLTDDERAIVRRWVVGRLTEIFDPVWDVLLDTASQVVAIVDGWVAERAGELDSDQAEG